MNHIREESLWYRYGSSDKVYHLQIDTENGGLYSVNFQYGRRGSTLNVGTKAKNISYKTAEAVYEKYLKEKLGKGYEITSEGGTGITFARPEVIPKSIPSKSEFKPNSKPASIVVKKIQWGEPSGVLQPKPVIFVPQLLNSIDESEVEKYLRDDNWGAQEKKDGKHQVIHKKAGKITVTNKKGQVIASPLEAIPSIISSCQDFILDAEAIGDTYHVFDLLKGYGINLKGASYKTRYESLNIASKDFSIETLEIVPLAIGYMEKKALYDRLQKDGKEGIVFKKLDSKFKSGRPASGGDMLKCKFYAELSARVRAVNTQRSVSLELLNDQGNWEDVGKVTIPPNKDIPSPGSIVEIRYLYAYKGGCLYQPIYKEPRDDIDANECTMKQIKYKAED
jgi:bifunctional non-homologous end joining protein LigD